MYGPTQRSQEGIQLACLSLAKYSYTTTSMSHRGPFNWSHIIGNGDIICIFERHAIPSPLYSRVLLKVMRDHDILVRIGVHACIFIIDVANADTTTPLGAD